MLKIVLHAIGRALITLVFGIPPVKPIADKQCIVISNHNTHLDTLVLFRLFPLLRVNSVKVIAAKDYFSRGLGGFIGRLLFNLILLDRRSTNVLSALEPIEAALKQGFSVIVYPEGTRGDPGVVQRFKSGIGKLAMDFPNLPVYPVFIHGVEKTLPRGGKLPVPFSVRLEVMSPVYGKDYLHLDNSQGRKLVTAHLEEIIRRATDDEEARKISHGRDADRM